MSTEETKETIRADLKSFLDAVGIDPADMNKNAKNSTKNLAQGGGGIIQGGGGRLQGGVNPLQSLTQTLQQARQGQPGVAQPPAPPAQQANIPDEGGIIVKGEIRVDEKYVESVQKVMNSVASTMTVRDEDGDVNLTDEQASFISEIMSMVQVKPVGSGTTLDQSLVQEMGKAYKERFEVAKAAGDEVTMNRAYGSMLALKKVMEMLK